MSDRKIELYSPKYFAACGIGGILSCGITHGLMTPIDLVKCNAQANPQDFKGTIQGFRLIMSGEGAKFGFNSGMRGIWKGFVPTFVGYSVQGLFKFGWYEYFKFSYAEAVGDEIFAKPGVKDLVYVFASASAEFLADLAYCPFEAVKVRVQTRPDYAVGLLDGATKMVKEEGFATLYSGIGPLWARQIPYTIIKFVAFERIATMVYSSIFKATGKAKDDLNSLEQMGVVFASGYLAGLFCGAVSHPADTLVSKINKIQMEGSLIEKSKVIYYGKGDVKGIGMAGLWAGFFPRLIMIGTLTGAQWFIYGAFKAAVGLPTPGAAAPASVEEVNEKSEE